MPVSNPEDPVQGPRATTAMPSRRARRYAVGGGLCVLAAASLLTVGLSGNIVYFRTVSEAVEGRNNAEGDRRVRMAGAVVPSSVHGTTNGVEFQLTDGKATAAVRHGGDPPELFREGAPVVCEGRWEGNDFACDRIMIKHGSEYRPPTVTKGG